MKVTSWWKYNPFLHKPRALEPLVPWGSFFYYGPDPSQGVSYGCYEEKSTGYTVISMIAPNIYSPVTGEEMDLITELNPEEAKEVFSSLNIKEAPKAFCFACGSEIVNTEMEEKTMGKKEEVSSKRKKLEAQLEKVRPFKSEADEDTSEFIGLDEILEKLNEPEMEESDDMDMDMDMSDQSDQSDEPDVEVDVEGPAEVDVEDSAEIEVDPAPAAESEDHYSEDSAEAKDDEDGNVPGEHEEPGEDQRSDDPADGSASAEEDMIDLDAIVSKVKEKVEAHRERKVSAEKRKEIRKRVLAKIKARQARAKLMTKKKEQSEASTESTVESKRAKMKEILANKRKEREEAKAAEAAAETAAETEAAEAAEAAETEAAETEAAETEAAETEAAETEAATTEAAETEATAKVEEKRKKLKEIVARKKAEAAKKKADSGSPMADEEMSQHEGKVQQLENPANKEHSPEMSKVGDAEKKNADQPYEMHASEDLRYETLANLKSLDSVAEKDLDMVLFGAESENPTWAVFAKGAPVARIQLKNQSNADEIREVFSSNDYALNLVKHCSDEGLVDTLEKVQAEFWANHVSDKNVADRYRSLAEARIEEEKQAVIGSFKNEFFDSVNTVISGFNKNFFKSDGHALKDSFFNNLVTAGMPESTATSIIEKSFAESSAEFFDQLFNKTVDFMKKSDEAKSEISQAILDCNVISPSSNQIEAGARIEDRLERATSLASLSSNMQVVDNRVQVDTDDYKSRLKKAWRK